MARRFECATADLIWALHIENICEVASATGDFLSRVSAMRGGTLSDDAYLSPLSADAIARGITKRDYHSGVFRWRGVGRDRGAQRSARQVSRRYFGRDSIRARKRVRLWLAYKRSGSLARGGYGRGDSDRSHA